MFEDALVAMFRMQSGNPIDEVFFKGSKHDWGVRLEFAQELFHLALSMADFPPEISCAAFLSDNLRVFYHERRLAVNYAVKPLAQMNARELCYLAIDQVKKVLLRRFASPPAEHRFLDGLDEQLFLTPVSLYSYWVQSREELKADYEKLAAKEGLSRFLYLFFQNLLRIGKRLLKKKKVKRT